MNTEHRPYGERDMERETFWLHLTEEQASAMAGGYVPNGVKGVLRELLDYELEDLKRAERPVRRKRCAAPSSLGADQEAQR